MIRILVLIVIVLFIAVMLTITLLVPLYRYYRNKGLDIQEGIDEVDKRAVKRGRGRPKKNV